MKIATTIFIILIIISPINIDASSSGDDGSASSSSTSSGGGGAPQFYDYYVPLVFDETHKDGYSEVSIWIIQPSALITSFTLNDAGVNSIQVSEPVKMTFNPVDNQGLTNGSRIRATSPMLVVGHRTNEDIFSDTSFAYSILIDRMMGFQFVSPVDGWISVFTLTSNTRIDVKNSEDQIIPTTINSASSARAIQVKKGDFINASAPITGAFISYNNGTYASMAVPKYLQGHDYIFDTDLMAERPEEIVLSYLTIIPDEPTEIQLLYPDSGIEKLIIEKPVQIKLSKNLRAIHSDRSKVSVTIHQKTVYGGLIRQSLVQLISSTEMRAGELFITPMGFSTHISVLKENSTFTTGIYDAEISNYNLAARTGISRNLFETIQYQGLSDSHLIIGDQESFSFITSPGKASHPMAPSVTFLNLPLNPSTNKPNVTGITSTWFRFPNLAIAEIKIIPGPPEEYTGHKIFVKIISNGSLPASRFNLVIRIDEEDVLEEEYEFLQVNSSLEFTFNEFFSFGKTSIKVTARVDVNDNVNEINEDDNLASLIVVVNQNIRLRISIFIAISLAIIFVIHRIRRRVKKRSQKIRSHVDTIITTEIGED